MTDEQFERLHQCLVTIAGELAGLRAAVMFAIDPPKVVKDGPPADLAARCVGVPKEACAIQDEEARIPRATFVDKHAWQCRGCRLSHTEIDGAAPG